jgi:hypothetical protein
VQVDAFIAKLEEERRQRSLTSAYASEN